LHSMTMPQLYSKLAHQLPDLQQDEAQLSLLLNHPEVTLALRHLPQLSQPPAAHLLPPLSLSHLSLKIISESQRQMYARASRGPINSTPTPWAASSRHLTEMTEMVSATRGPIHYPGNPQSPSRRERMNHTSEMPIPFPLSPLTTRAVKSLKLSLTSSHYSLNCNTLPSRFSDTPQTSCPSSLTGPLDPKVMLTSQKNHLTSTHYSPNCKQLPIHSLPTLLLWYGDYYVLPFKHSR